MHKIVIASDSFKGSLSSAEVAAAAAKGVHEALPECQTVCMEIADGGEGTAATLTRALGGHLVSIEVSDPLGRRITAEYGIAETDGQKIAIIEISQASGLTLLSPRERNPLLTSTYGTGEMILDAARRGCRRFLAGLGGSATNDGGTGMLEALGCRFLDSDGQTITGLCGNRLAQIAVIDTSDIPKEISGSEFLTACDVDTPFCGHEGAAAVFGPQKGATPEAVSLLEEGMQHFNSIIEKTCGTDLSRIKGTGAAGGLGGAFHAFLGAKLCSGTEMVLDAIGFDAMAKDADLIITGEGKVDCQTSRGKVISGVTARARKYGVPVIAIAGIVDMNEDSIRQSGLAAVCAIGPRPQNESDLEHAMRPEVASRNISDTVAKALVSLSPSLFRGNL